LTSGGNSFNDFPQNQLNKIVFYLLKRGGPRAPHFDPRLFTDDYQNYNYCGIAIAQLSFLTLLSSLHLLWRQNKTTRFESFRRSHCSRLQPWIILRRVEYATNILGEHVSIVWGFSWGLQV